MSYKYSKGEQVIGDLKAADDTQRDTLIDFGEDYIGFETSGSVRMVISGSDGKVGVGVSSPSYRLDVNGDIRVRGNDIRDNSGNKSISFDGSANTTIVNNLTVQDYTFPSSDGNANQVLQTNGSGQLSFATISGGGSGGNDLSVTSQKTVNYTASNWEFVLVNLVGASNDITITFVFFFVSLLLLLLLCLELLSILLLLL